MKDEELYESYKLEEMAEAKSNEVSIPETKIDADEFFARHSHKNYKDEDKKDEKRSPKKIILGLILILFMLSPLIIELVNI